MSMPDNHLRRRLSQLLQEIKAERQEHILRAVDFRNHGDMAQAQYHAGLADGRNSMLTVLRALTSEYPADRMPVEV